MNVPSYIEQVAVSTWAVWIEAAPWLLLGLLTAGLIKAFLPATLLKRWMGGTGIGSVVRAALVGTPLPLCSCSVIPAAVQVRRQGASKGATVSFLVATPENGADSIALTYALLGPFMTVIRPVAAIVSAIGAGVLTLWFVKEPTPAGASEATQHCTTTTPACCSSTAEAPDVNPGPSAACCGTESVKPQAACCSEGEMEAGAAWWRKLWDGVRYAAGDLLRDIAGWLLIGIVLAGVVNAFVDPGALASWGSGLPAMGLMLLIGVPMYICATASTPVAAAMLAAGVSPGVVLVFLLAGPATNLATIGVVRRELGNAAVATYLFGVAGGAVGFGVLTDWLVGRFHFPVTTAAPFAEMEHLHTFALVCGLVLAGLFVKVLAEQAWTRWHNATSRSDSPRHEVAEPGEPGASAPGYS